MQEQNRATGKLQGVKGAAGTFQQVLEKKWLRACGRDLLGMWAGPPSLLPPANMGWCWALVDKTLLQPPPST